MLRIFFLSLLSTFKCYEIWSQIFLTGCFDGAGLILSTESLVPYWGLFGENVPD
jgi:hypothetical protein